LADIVIYKDWERLNIGEADKPNNNIDSEQNIQENKLLPD